MTNNNSDNNNSNNNNNNQNKDSYTPPKVWTAPKQGENGGKFAGTEGRGARQREKAAWSGRRAECPLWEKCSQPLTQ